MNRNPSKGSPQNTFVKKCMFCYKISRTIFCRPRNQTPRVYIKMQQFHYVGEKSCALC